MSELGGMLRALWRFHRLLAGILVLEYAIAFAIMLVASDILFTRVDAISEASGVDEAGLYVLQGLGQGREVHATDLHDARERFAALVGGTRVARGSSVPFLGAYGEQVAIDTADGMPGAALQVNAYEGDAGFAPVLGLRLEQGRWFRPDEIVRHYGENAHLVVLSHALAQRLFHGGAAVGRQVRIGGDLHLVIGVMGPLAAPAYLGSRDTTLTLLLPRLVGGNGVLVIRHAGAASGLRAVLASLRKRSAGEVEWSLTSYSNLRAGYFQQDRLVVWALAMVDAAVLLTALCGILGLTNHWVAKRRPQIAIRLALGATRRDIQRHFLMETGLLAGAGLAMGGMLAGCGAAAFQGVSLLGGPGVWVFSAALVLMLAMLVVYASLRRWSRMGPVELLRQV